MVKIKNQRKKEGVNYMPKVMVNLSLEDLVRIINSMDEEEIETLSLMLSGEDKELLERKRDIETGKVKTLSRKEVFDV